MTSYFYDGGHDVILHRKVLPSGVCLPIVRRVSATTFAVAGSVCM